MTTARTFSDRRVGLARCVGVGALVIPWFGPLDVFLHATLFPTSNLALVLALRGLATLAVALAWWIARSPRFGDRTVAVTHALSLTATSAALGGMGIQLGGIASIYVHGLSVIFMVRSATVAAPVRDSLAHGVLVALAYPAVFGVAYALDPGAHAAWWSPGQLSMFGAHYILVCAAMVCGVVASRANWIAQTQLYQARKLGRYRLQAPIGKGGQGEVWLARDGKAARNVALKVLVATGASPHAVRMFEREAALAQQLTSPHTVRILDFGASDDGVYYLAMEHLDGADLAALIRGHGPMPPARVVHFAIQACRSLEEAHGKHLVHRDIKPSNLFAAQLDGAFDHLKLLDFGVARSVVDDDHLTRTGVVRGTPAYMAPECCRGELATPAADLYGLGATMYHLLTGEPPFTGDEAQLVARHLDTPPEPPSARAPTAIDADLEAVVLRCLAKDPAQRFADAAALRAALEACAAAGAWTQADAAQFWGRDRHAALARWQAETVA